MDSFEKKNTAAVILVYKTIQPIHKREYLKPLTSLGSIPSYVHRTN